MKNRAGRISALCRKELFSWFNSPSLYGITVFFLVFISVWFYYLRHFFAMDSASLRPFFSSFPFAYIGVIPVLTMKSWAEERKTGSEEILFSLPLSEWELVLGKYISCLILLLAMLILTIPVPLSLLPLGYFDPGVIFSEYLGAVLLGSGAISLGLFMSCISKSQGASFLAAASVLLFSNLISGLTQFLPNSLAGFVNFISLTYHFESFSRGLLDSRDIAFFFLITVLFLYLNAKSLYFRKLG